MSITVIIADDHAVIRDGLRSVFEKQPDIDVVGEASDGRQAVKLAAELHPAVAIVDITMPELNGIEAARLIREQSPFTQVVILSMCSTAEHIFQARKAGALGYVLKESAAAEVATAVRAVQRGRRYYSAAIDENTVASYGMRREAGKEEGSPLERLSGREREILQLVVEGKSSAEIAETLSLSRKTVESYRSRLMAKLGTPDVPALVKFAVRHGLTPLK